jgi:5-formyltetrahydrofolate cyclo-ligase
MQAKKKQLRKLVKVRIKALSAAEKEKRATALLRAVWNHPLFASAQHVMLFWPLPDEINTIPLIEHAHAVGKHVFLPVVVGDDLVVKPYNPTTMQPGAFGILEPQGEPVSPTVLDVIVVPGVAFDAACNRMGRGKGFYDRLLANASVPTIGVCYAEQYYLNIPTEVHDVPLHNVLVV